MGERLAGRTAVITGGASGIGLATAELFIEEGARVVVADVQDERGAALEDRYPGGELAYVQTDVRVESDVERAVRAAVDRFGRLDVMFNNAGIASEGLSIPDLDIDAFDRQMSLLARGVALGHKYAARQFQAQQSGGSIVSTSSTAGLRGGWADIAYTAAKHAVTGIIRVATAELGPLGIRSNAIYPGVTLTPTLSGMFVRPEENTAEFREFLGERFASASPLRSTGRPEDIARAAVFLASDESRWISGVSLPVDGGATAVYPAPFGELGPEAARDFRARSAPEGQPPGAG